MTLEASASTGAERYAWDLNGDGRTDVDCGAQPRISVRFAPLGHAQSVDLAVTGGGGSAHADQLVQITGPGLPPAAQRFGSTAFCDGLDPAHGVEDVTAHGGPRAGCGFAVQVGLVEGIGCLFRVNTRVKVDEPVLKAIALLYAQDPDYRAYVNAASTAAGLSRPDGNGLLGRKEFETALDVSDFYVSTGAVRVNGLDFYPRPGTEIVLAPALQRVIAENAIVKLGDAVVRQVPLVLDVSVKHGRVDVGDVNLTGRLPAIGSFPLTKQAHVTFTRPGVSRVNVHFRPPSWTSLLAGDGAAPTFDGTVTITNAGGFDVAQIDAHLGVLSFGPWRLGDVNVGYRRFDDSGALVDRWQITGALTLGALADDGLLLTPPPRNGIIFEHGRFKSAGAEVVFDTLPPPQIFPGVALQQIGAHVELDPAAFLGSARLRVLGVADVDGKLVAAVPSADAPYKLGPLFRGMPTSLAEHPFTAPVFALGGTTKIRSFELGDGYFVYGYPGMVAFGGGIDRNFFDIVMLRGRIDGALNVANQRFNLVGQVKGCLIVRDFCGGATAVISSQGAGGCVEVGPFSAGGGVQWPHEVFPWPLDGCKWSRFTEDHVFESSAHASQAATRPYTVHIRAGDPSRAIRIDGTGRAPAVKVSGPDGETLESSAASGVKFGRHLRILRSTEHAITVIGLQDPPPGDYTIERLAGSAAWARTSAADDPPDARITARITGTGPRRTLRYAVRRRPDQRVTFAARGPAGEQVIGTIAGGGRGTLRFTPTPGRGKRTIVAHIELAGLPAEQPTVAHFRPPALPRRAGRPRRLRITRRATTLRLRWHRVPRAARYSIVVRERGGAIRQALTRRPRATIRRVPPSRAGTIAIRAVDAVGASGPPRRSRFSARQSPRTAFAPYAQLGRRRSPERRGSTPRPPKA